MRERLSALGADLMVRLHREIIADDAEFSPNGLERLWLSRKVAEEGQAGLIIGLNPSTAGAANDDQTIRKEKEFARRWGWGGFWKLNLFTRIETVSTKLKQMTLQEATGEYADQVLDAFIPKAFEIVVCWGAAVPKHMASRVEVVKGQIARRKWAAARVLCFGTTNAGAPKHPLYLPYETPLVEFELPTARRGRRDD